MRAAVIVLLFMLSVLFYMVSCRESGKLLSQYMEENKKLHEENKRLRAALKPVLECPDRWNGHWPFAAYASDAVKKSQRTYNESEVTK